MIGAARARLRIGRRLLAATGAVDVLVGVPVAVDVVVEELRDVVGDDVEDHLEAVLVHLLDHLAQLGQIAEVRIDVREILLPIAVIGVEVGVGVEVAHHRRDPDRGDAERLQVIEVIDDALPVAALVEPERAGHDVGVVVEIAVGEAIDEQLIDDLVAPVAGRADLVGRLPVAVDARGVGAPDGERSDERD